ncbi:cupin-like domain-containing protein [Qipengyuania zhejiangensis]|uniref:cupin-like domain-containing protein n=1 Tax=Qipengyuania zhejiangensis TaxID=3077782 RepID=UPI002D775236|nr:cupin-like domain-containing protein [Qipengyuania sp. Z2]
MADADPAIFSAMRTVDEREAGDPAALAAAIDKASEPFVVRGLVRDWPLVRAGLESGRAARQYLLERARPAPFTVSIGEPGRDGRLFYDDDFAMNFRTARGKLADIFRGFDDNEGRADAPAIYLTSVDMRTFFTGLAEDNPSPVIDREPLESIWIGTATRVAAHSDFPRNLACCAVGHRRFTVFPPDQYRNLYLGPIENTPAGRTVSMVDFHAPDLDAYPRFAEAMENGMVAELEPGDAIYIPSMWWHHVEGLDPFNILVNYWWRETPAFLGQPQEALNHAILALRDLPQADKDIWRELFDYYVFDSAPDVTDHIPEAARGILDTLTPETAGQIRAFLLRTLNR